MIIFAAFWLLGTLAILVVFSIDGEIRVNDVALAVASGWGWPIFVPLFLIGRYGDRVIWRRK
ncbi:hypothetical protein [Burkholderia gladioli]|uniref:hypothetical protein n=1 Tax=Burkholderia gladioli TaxID=28095 RepID=UPI00164096BA|nr:hypothetical protein [Burkholderia gladioli]